jgi:hypothetical protein
MIKQKFKNIFIIIPVTLVALASLTVYSFIHPQEDKPLFTENEYKAHLKFLANDLLEGRAPGTRGGDLAALYIASQFEAAGLRPISEENGYFQQVPAFDFTIIDKSVSFELSTENKSKELEYGEDIVLFSELLKEEIILDDELLFVGYGIEAPEYRWDDFKGIDLKNKIIVMLCNEPDYGKTGFGFEGLSYYGSPFTYKEDIARIKGAKGLIICHNEEEIGQPLSWFQHSLGSRWVRLESQMQKPLGLYAWISRQAIDEVLSFAGLSYDQLKLKADSKDFHPIPLGVKAKAVFNQKYRKFSSPNVIGIVPGTDMRDEAVVFMAHYDHLGMNPLIEGDNIYNGAYDNASGTSALICLAQAFASTPQKRSLVFLATTDEEKMMLGADFYASHPVLPLENTIIALNMDGVSLYGRNDGFRMFPVQYTSAGPSLEALGHKLGLRLIDSGPDKIGSAFVFDNIAFCTRGIVSLRFKLDGNYLSLTEEEITNIEEKIGPIYHLPSDEIYPYYRYDGALQTMETLYSIGCYYAGEAEKPEMLKGNPYELAYRIRKQVYH